MNGLLPYNNAGLVDPFANAMQGGLGQMYAIQEAQAQARDQDQNYLGALNKYNNDLMDNPNKQEARDLLAASQAIQKRQFDSGAMGEAMDEELETKKQVGLGEQARSKTGPQIELAAQQTSQFIDDMEAIDKAGGGDLGKQKYWGERVAPMFKKMGGPTDYNPDRLLKINESLISKTKHGQQMEVLQQQGANQVGAAAVRGDFQLRSAQERAAARDAAMADRSDTVVANYLREHPELIPEFVTGKISKDSASTLGAVSRDVGVKMAVLEAKTAENTLNAAIEEGDTKEIEEAAKEVNRAKDKLDLAIKKTQSMGQRGSTSAPKQEEKKDPYTFEGKTYPAKSGYHIGRNTDGKLGYIKN